MYKSSFPQKKNFHDDPKLCLMAKPRQEFAWIKTNNRLTPIIATHIKTNANLKINYITIKKIIKDANATYV